MKRYYFYPAMLFVASIVLISCSSANSNREDYFGYNNNPNKEIRNQKSRLSDASEEDEWKNPLSDDYASSNQRTEIDSVEKESEPKQIVNYYFYNTYPHYVPVSIPWWGCNGWYRYSLPRIYVYVGTPWYWWDYYWYDWYAPWYRYHPYYGSRWVYYPDYWDWHYYHHHHNYLDWYDYHYRHYPTRYNNDYKKRTVRKFGPNRTIEIADDNTNINRTRLSTVGGSSISRTNKVTEGDNKINVNTELKPDSRRYPLIGEKSLQNLSNDVFRTPVAVTGENLRDREIAVEKSRERQVDNESQVKTDNSFKITKQNISSHSEKVITDNLPVKGPGTVFKESLNWVGQNDLGNKSEKVETNPVISTQDKRTRIEMSDKKVEGFKYLETKAKSFEKAPRNIDYSNFNKREESKRNIEGGSSERKVQESDRSRERKSTESGFTKFIENVFDAIGNSSSSESSRSRSSSNSSESNRSTGSYSSPGSSNSSGSSSSERSRRAR